MSCHKLLALIFHDKKCYFTFSTYEIPDKISHTRSNQLSLVRFLLHHHLLSVGVLSVKPPCLFCSKCYTPLTKPLSYVKNDYGDMLFLKTKYALKGDFVMVILTL